MLLEVCGSCVFVGVPRNSIFRTLWEPPYDIHNGQEYFSQRYRTNDVLTFWSDLTYYVPKPLNTSIKHEPATLVTNLLRSGHIEYLISDILYSTSDNRSLTQADTEANASKAENSLLLEGVTHSRLRESPADKILYIYQVM